eukprot:77864-Rhodomonas_salina.1
METPGARPYRPFCMDTCHAASLRTAQYGHVSRCVPAYRAVRTRVTMRPYVPHSTDTCHAAPLRTA